MDDRELDHMFAEMADTDARPDAALTGAILADAARMAEGRRGLWPVLSRAGSRWLSAGFAACLACGVWIGAGDMLLPDSVTIDLGDIAIESSLDALTAIEG